MITANDRCVALLRKALDDARGMVIRETALGHFEAADEYDKMADDYLAKLRYRLEHGKPMPITS